MDSYADRISKFNGMVADTAQHVNAIRDAATKYDTKDPVGSALTITGASAGGVAGIAGSITGMQHFKDFKKMYKTASQRLGKNTSDNPSGAADQGGGDGVDRAPTNSSQAGGQSRGNAAGDNDGAAARPQVDANPAQGNAGSGGAEIDGGLNNRIDNLGNNANPTQEANSINQAIESKATASGIDKADLNSRLATSGRSSNELRGINRFNEGPLKTDSQAEYLRFKNNVANDAIGRQNAGQPPASGYDTKGNPTGDAPGPQAQASGGDVVRTAADEPNAVAAPDGNLGGGALGPDVNVAPVQNAAGDISSAATDAQQQVGGLVAQGRAALSNLVGGQQVPGPGGSVVQGLTTNVDVSQAANAGSRLQQGLADQTQGARSALAHPNTGGGQPANANAATQSGTDGSSTAPGGGSEAPAVQPSAASSATSAADDADAGTVMARGLNTASKVTSTLSDVNDVGDAVDLMAGFSGPAAPIVGIVGGLISLGTTIAGLIHKKPEAKTKAPPPSAPSSIGANLSSTQSMGGGGIY